MTDAAVSGDISELGEQTERAIGRQLVSARESAATLVESVLGSLGAENEAVHLWV